VNSGGWLYQLSDQHLRDAVLARAVSHGEGIDGVELTRRREALERIGLSANDAERVAPHSPMSGHVLVRYAPPHMPGPTDPCSGLPAPVETVRPARDVPWVGER
jgi:hypothetical protein